MVRVMVMMMVVVVDFQVRSEATGSERLSKATKDTKLLGEGIGTRHQMLGLVTPGLPMVIPLLLRSPQPGPTLMSLLSTYHEATPLQACSKTPPCAKVCGFGHGRDIGPGLKNLRSGFLITLPPF